MNKDIGKDHNHREHGCHLEHTDDHVDDSTFHDQLEMDSRGRVFPMDRNRKEQEKSLMGSFGASGTSGGTSSSSGTDEDGACVVLVDQVSESPNSNTSPNASTVETSATTSRRRTTTTHAAVSREEDEAIVFQKIIESAARALPHPSDEERLLSSSAPSLHQTQGDDVKQSLQHQQRQHEEHQPGAYAGIPGGSFHRLEHEVPFASLVGVGVATESSGDDDEVPFDDTADTDSFVYTEEERNPDLETGNLDSHNEGPALANGVSSDLAVANPVDDEDDDLPRAQQMDSEDREESHARAITTRKLLLGLGASMAANVILAVIFGVMFVLRGSNSVGENPTIVAATVPPSSVNSSGATTNSSTLSPVKEKVTSLLQNYTLQAIEDDPESPQSKAFRFIMNDPNLESYLEDDDEGDWRIQQRFALAAFYYATDGDNWKDHTGWLDYELHECKWSTQPATFLGMDYNVTTNSFYYVQTIPLSNYSNSCEEEDLDHIQNGKYMYISQWANGISGELPPELFMYLPLLESLNLAGVPSIWDDESGEFVQKSGITGTLPSEIGMCTELAMLSIVNSRLTGSLPSALWQLPSLVYLGMNYNFDLSGTIASELGLMTNMQFLDVSNNQITGTIPSELGLLEHLTFLNLWENDLSGSIPTWVGQLSSVEYVLLMGNQLSGQMPATLAQLSTLMWLDVSDNQISGTIPSELAMLPSLQVLDLHVNKLTGTVPAQLGQLAVNGSLSMIDIQNNNMSGILSDDLCFMEWGPISFDCNWALCGCGCACGTNSTTNETMATNKVL